MIQRGEILTAALLMVAIALCPSSVASQTQTNPPEQKATALPWPAPDAWSMTSQEWVRDRWINGWMLLEYKKAYIQSALPAEEAGAPSWFSRRYEAAQPDAAELRVFVRTTQTTESKFDWQTASARVYGIPGTQTLQRIAYQILVTNAKGERVMTGFGYTVQEAWNELGRMIGFEEYRQARELRKAEKERQKAERKKKP